ncbi:hypothetical protein SAMN06265360_105269 [Haloechinothrix alba]|uniref:Uncharacterized protein n=2 Tax=Haloechinothrix alba TaxID=664784 RepID=A0A238WAQ0_9PSEU|nr:hypothetical protein [Haloechinothrix alba]SNR43283.1 hypothetical protein SAMN06265360_105269 [Haloechinothrix alba]
MATDYGQGLDAAVFTAAFEKLTVSAPLLVLPASYPAAADPNFLGSTVDPGYMTTLPDTRRNVFYEPMTVDPAVVRYDEANKSTYAATELANYPLILNRPLDVRVPVFLVAGSEDSLFCKENFSAAPAATGGSGDIGEALEDVATPLKGSLPQTNELTGSTLGGTDCDSTEALVSDEAAHFGPNTPSVDGFVLPEAGHSLNQAPDSQRYFDAVNGWIDETVGGAAH